MARPAPTTSPQLTIRPARPSEAAALGDLALRSKGYWGYSPTFLDACRTDLSYSPEAIATRPFFVAEIEGSVAGFYALAPVDRGLVDLEALFVAPEAIGQGVGRRLWAHAVAQCRAIGATTLRIEADPFAEGFYLAMGALRVGEAPSAAIPGRFLPLLHYSLHAATE